MVWKIEFDPAAERELGKIDPKNAKRILAFFHQRLSQLENPHSLGAALKGSKLGDFWKYRVGDYRIVASIEDHAMVILVLRVGNRKNVYRK